MLLLLALACTAMALNPSVLLLPVVIFALRFTGQGMASHVALVAMARWFIATRGRALAIATLGFQAGEAILPLSFVALKRLFAWHDLWLGVAVLVLACIPLLLLLLRQERTPQSMAEINAAPGMEGRHWTRAQALRHPLVWRLLPGLAGFSALGTSFWFHQVHYAAEKGWDHLALVAVFPLGTGAFIASTAAYGWALDRVGSARLMPVYLLPLALGFSLLAFAPAVWAAALGVICMGIAGGGQATLPAACWAEFYGTRHIGSIKAAVASAMVLGSALGPGISGRADRCRYRDAGAACGLCRLLHRGLGPDGRPVAPRPRGLSRTGADRRSTRPEPPWLRCASATCSTILPSGGSASHCGT